MDRWTYRRLRAIVLFVALHAEGIGEPILPREIFVFGPVRRGRSLILGIGEEPAEGEPYFQPIGAKIELLGFETQTLHITQYNVLMHHREPNYFPTCI